MQKDDLFLLKNMLNQYCVITEAQWKRAQNFLVYKEVEKGEYIVQEGDRANRIYFIISGLFRVYCISDNGDERIHVFRSENEFLSAYSSFLEDKPSEYSIQAIERSRVYYISITDYNNLVKEDAYWELLSGRYTKKLFLEKEIREKAFLTEDATTRYLNFVDDYSKIEKRITNNQIASYLGITPVALSRIRSKLI